MNKENLNKFICNTYSIEPSKIISDKNKQVLKIQRIEDGTIEYEALKRDIDSTGQINPIIIWRGEVIDGRTRLAICQSLNIEVTVSEIKWNTLDDEISEIIDLLHAGKTKRTSSYIIDIIESPSCTGLKIKDLALRTQSSPTVIKQLKYIKKNNIDIYNILKCGNKVRINTKNGNTKDTDKVSPIYNAIKLESIVTGAREGDNKTNSSVVYFITDGRYTKIGVSDDAETRLKTLQCGNPYKLTIEKTIVSDNPYELEAQLHEEYKDKKIRGEWFMI